MKRVKRDPATISPRFAKPLAKRKINLTKRTLRRLFFGWRFGLLDETHLEKLLSGYPRKIHRELELTKAGLIYHPEVQIPLRAVCTGIDWITALTTKGADMLAGKGYRIDPTMHRERYRRHRSFNAILHDLNRSDFLVELETAVRAVGKDAGIQLCHQDEFLQRPYTETISFSSMVVWKREHRPVTVEPDGYFALSLPNLPSDRAEKFFALEIDQDTESNIRWTNFWDQKSILKTMIAYGEAHKRGIIEDKLGLSNLRTIFVTTTERHIANILKDAGQCYIAQGYPANACLFVSREKLETFDPLSVEYKNAAGQTIVISEWV